MGTPFSHAPHVEGAPAPAKLAPNAALLIDFDNVTMGMRSDLSKELKSLLQSEVIRGKVTVQRAYADWRRYPQYIVPLSEASVDLIFAPAYGSSKKNATDIRMAIDAIELVFVRPEIGTFILLTGDSDFSSLVLKLKEYGKYVIGVGIQESSSDILVQNCDEYYSYTSLTGLRKTTDSSAKPMDPWQLVSKAVERMVSRSDVMRSDRLKQVMIEIDGNFSEGNFGFSKFSKFITEAASRGLIGLRKLENGQYEISVDGRGRDDRKGGSDRPKDRGRDDARRKSGRRGRPDRAPRVEEAAGAAEVATLPPEAADGAGDPLDGAYRLLVEALEAHAEAGRSSVRDSDVKRKLLELRPGFDEAELGFGKFSRFLRQAHDHEIVDLEKLETGNYVVSLPTARVAGASGVGRATGESDTEPDKAPAVPESSAERTKSLSAPTAHPAPSGSAEPVEQGGSGGLWERVSGMGRRLMGGGEKSGGVEATARTGGALDSAGPARTVEVPDTGRGTGLVRRSGSDGGRSGGADGGRAAGGVTLLEGQILGSASTSGGNGDLDLSTLGLPRDEGAIVQYLTNSYRGVGQKTAESMVEAFGADLFKVFQEEPDRLRKVVPRRADDVLEAWRADLARRTAERR